MQRRLEVHLFYRTKLAFWLGCLVAVEFSMKNISEAQDSFMEQEETERCN